MGTFDYIKLKFYEQQYILEINRKFNLRNQTFFLLAMFILYSTYIFSYIAHHYNDQYSPLIKAYYIIIAMGLVWCFSLLMCCLFRIKIENNKFIILKATMIPKPEHIGKYYETATNRESYEHMLACYKDNIQINYKVNDYVAYTLHKLNIVMSITLLGFLPVFFF